MTDRGPGSDDARGEATDTGPAVPSGVGPPKHDRVSDDGDELQVGGELSFPASDPPSAAVPGARDEAQPR